MNTSENGIALISHCEGCRLKAHNTWGRWEIGYGFENALFPGTPGEIKVVEGLTITQQQADDALRFFVFQVVDPLVKQFFNCQNQDEHDAVASFVFNIRHDKLRRHAYSLPDLINKPDRSPEAVDAIISKWMLYFRTPGAETGLYRRRILELCVFLGLPWNAPAVLGQLAMIRAGDDPEPVFAAAEHLYEQLDENAQTAALNNKQAKALGGKPVEYVPPDTPLQKPKVKAKPVETPALPPEPEAVPMEKSGTHKNLSNADTGKEIVATGAVTTTVLAGTMPWMNQISAFIQKTDMMTIYKTAGVLLAIFMIIGGVRWWWGRMGAYRERQQTTRVKV